MCFQGGFGDFFTFYELESLRLLSRRSIRSGIRGEARKGNCGSKQCCCCDQLCSHSFGSFLGRIPPLERVARFLRMTSQAPSAQHDKRGGVSPPCPLTISPAHSSPHLPNKSSNFCYLKQKLQVTKVKAIFYTTSNE